MLCKSRGSLGVMRVCKRRDQCLGIKAKRRLLSTNPGRAQSRRLLCENQAAAKSSTGLHHDPEKMGSIVRTATVMGIPFFKSHSVGIFTGGGEFEVL
ncbi:MAG: hypothetical protein ACPIOQ_15105 [Promethearchaeia archaeon]